MKTKFISQSNNILTKFQYQKLLSKILTKTHFFNLKRKHKSIIKGELKEQNHPRPRHKLILITQINIHEKKSHKTEIKRESYRIYGQ